MKISHPHFSIVKGKTHYFHLSVVVAVALFVAAMSAIAVITLTTDLAALQDEVTSAKRATLSLDTPASEVRVGDIFPVNTFLDVDLPTTGVDVAMEYDPGYLELRKQDGSSFESDLNYLDSSLSIFDIVPYAKVSRNGAMAVFRFSAIAKPLKEFRGRGVVGTVTFKALKRGDTTVSIIYESGSGSDSNVAYLGRNILTGTRNLDLKIR